MQTINAYSAHHDATGSMQSWTMQGVHGAFIKMKFPVPINIWILFVGRIFLAYTLQPPNMDEKY
jgi:hypothetical protein